MFLDAETSEPVFETLAPKGAALLDEKMPGWADKIDLDELQLNDQCNCVLGQVYGGYDDGTAELFGYIFDDAREGDVPDWGTARAYGFDAGFMNGEFTGFGDLQKEWEYLIEQRRTVDT